MSAHHHKLEVKSPFFRNYLIGPSKNEGYNSTRTPIPEVTFVISHNTR